MTITMMLADTAKPMIRWGCHYAPASEGAGGPPSKLTSVDPAQPPQAKQPQASAPPGTIRRFYTDVTVEPVERVEPLDAGAAADGHDRYQIKLSGRTIKTPARQTLALPTEALAEAIADEWRAQGDLIDPQSMPLTKLANTTCDGILARADDVRAEILAFVGRDLVCYRAATPFDLFERQQTQWAPALRWAEQTFGCPLVTTEGLMPIEQPTEVLAGAKSAIDRLAPWQLGAVHVITTLTGSGVMALMLANEAILPESVWDAAHVDDTYQAEQWGADAEAKARLDYRKAEMLSACRFLEAVREGQEH